MKLQHYLILGLIHGLAKLPFRLLQHLGAMLGFIGYWVPNSLKSVTQINIETCFPEISKPQQKALIKQSLIESGKTGLEMPGLWLKPHEKCLSLIQEIQGEREVFEAWQQNKKGLILLCLHMSSWELINLYLASRFPMVIMYKPAKQLYMDKLIHTARERSGNTLVPTNTVGVKAIFRALKDNKVTAILPDQDPGNNGGVFAPFFNIPTHTMTLVPRLANKTKSPTFYIYAERLKNGKFIIYFKRTDKCLADSDAHIACTAMNKGMESCILKAPAQYQWNYRRFKRRPNNEAHFYN